MVLQIITFMLVTVFYGAYFYKQIQLKRKGIQTNRLGKGSKPRRTATIETALYIATYVTAAIQYASVFLSLYMLPISFRVPVRIIGFVLMGCGVLFFILAVVTMRDSWRAGVDESQKTSIVTTGVYRLSRNPAFVGFDLLYIGTALAMPNIIMTIAALSTIYLLHLQILEEEKYLPTVFGKEYEDYKKSTPRYFLFF